MKPRLLIFGAGGHGKIVTEIALQVGLLPRQIVDDAPKVSQLLNVRVSRFDQLACQPPFDFVIAIGTNSNRRQKFDLLLRLGGTPVTITHPWTAISKHSVIGQGTVCCAGAVVQAGTDIAQNCIVNTGASIDHDCRIGAHTHVCPGVRLAGEVIVGCEVMIGTSAAVIPGITIGDKAVIGAGAVVVRDVPAGAVVYGNPARVKRTV